MESVTNTASIFADVLKFSKQPPDKSHQCLRSFKALILILRALHSSGEAVKNSKTCWEQL